MKSFNKIILVAVTIITLSCSSSDSGGSSSTPQVSFITAKINGDTFTTIQSNGTSFAGATRGILGNPSSIGLSGIAASGTAPSVNIVLIGNITVGNYQLSYHESGIEGSSITFQDTGSSIDCEGSSGIITITTLNSTEIEGTFSFNTNCAESSINVTEGKFKCFFSSSNGSNTPILSDPVTDIDQNIYPAVIIGTQIWMQKNLNVSKYQDGDIIPQVTDPTEWSNLTTGAWCYYENNTPNGIIYGKLYNWYAVAGIYDAASLANPALRKELAPTGWHVPTDAEWTILTNFLEGDGGKMKATTGWSAPNYGATNSSGFTGLPGGIRLGNATFQSIDTSGYWWSSSEFENDMTIAYNRYLNYGNTFIFRVPGTIKNGISVRCIKN